MPKYTASEEQVVKDLVAPIAQAPGTITGTGIDCRGYDEALIELAVGVIPSNGTLDVHIEESASLSTGYADITDAVFAQKVAATGATSYVGRLNLRERKRYIRAIAVIANQTIPLYVGAILSQAQVNPVAQVNAVGFNV
ncbi:MAG: hypothetical protein WC443_06380 [Desulfobaccales bacterium]